MPHLYLPSDHTDADLVLAADIAAAVSSAELYVTWTIEDGQGPPEVEAILRDERQQPVRGGLVFAIARGIRAIWRAIVGPPPAQRAPRPVSQDTPRVEGEPSL
jgi:hypothetical protein